MNNDQLHLSILDILGIDFKRSTYFTEKPVYRLEYFDRIIEYSPEEKDNTWYLVVKTKKTGRGYEFKKVHLDIQTYDDLKNTIKILRFKTDKI